MLLAAVAATSCSHGGTNTWSGRWRREWGGGDVLTLVQHGDRVTGAFGWTWCTNVQGGWVMGTAHGGTLTGRFGHVGGPQGTLVLSLVDGNRHIRGDFRVGSAGCTSSAPFQADYVGTAAAPAQAG